MHLPCRRRHLVLVLTLGFLAWALLSVGALVQGAERPKRLPVQEPACLVSDTDAHRIRVEVAKTPAQRQYGLMERSRLDDDAGMLFVYPEVMPPTHSFWMYKTLIPLDIAFISEAGEIRAIQSMAPCPATGTGCPSYPATVPFTMALEMNLGYFQKHDIGVGDHFSLESPARCQ